MHSKRNLEITETLRLGQKNGSLLYLIDKCQSSGNDCVFMFHSILKPEEEYYSDMWTWDYNKFEELCDYLCDIEDKGKIKVEKLIDSLD